MPSEQVEWVLHISFAGDPRLNPVEIENTFNQEWRETYGGFMSYGRDAESEQWTFLISADGPQSVTALKFAWDYVDPLRDDPPLATATMYERRRSEVARRLASFGEVTVRPSLQADAAVTRAQKLLELKKELDWSATIVLEAPRRMRFEGRQIWDVMLCLGLRWGDMDCFHWENPSQRGDDYFFSVWTSSPPGYFLPEQVAAGRVQTDDLVFGFSVPRCAAPREVFDAMVRAASYAQRRLGGRLVDERGEPLDADRTRDRIDRTVRRLEDAALTPGEDVTLRLF